MTSEEFVKEFHLLKQSLIESAFNTTEGTTVSTRVAALKIDDATKAQLKDIVSLILTDAFYTILLGLDGEASIGRKQELYKIFDEEGNELTGGEIEGYAWEYFHNNKQQ